MVIKQENAWRRSNTFKKYTEHKFSLILKITVQSNSQKWLGDDKSHTLSSTNQGVYKTLSISCQSVWADHDPAVEFRNNQHWVT
jgi:hypothetical protein